MTLHSEFKDYFSGDSEAYARYRPDYPPSLFEYLASLVDQPDLAWDAGTGNGQAAVGLAGHFHLVVATDASEAQLSAAVPHPRVHYRLALAQASGLESGTVALATAAQAIHWFDREQYFAEVTRVLRPVGVLAVWGYGDLTMDDAKLEAIVNRLSKETVGRWWTADRALVDEHYASVSLPFPELAPPTFALRANWTLAELVGYLATWSAVRRYREDQQVDPIPPVAGELAASWGEPDLRHQIEWPLFLRVGRKP
jgi:SAM-dependent methyltransferase